MITFYFDINAQHLIQAPGNQQQASPLTWVYGDNYNVQVYVVALGAYQPILSTDTLTAILWQPSNPPSGPQQQLAIIGTPAIKQDPAGNSYFQLNINLKTDVLATLVQTSFQPAKTFFHFLFNPTDLERFSQSADLAITVNPDPFLGSTGAVPVPPGYPINPSAIFEYLANKGAPNGYAGLDGGALVAAAHLPLAALPNTPGINYPVDGVSIGIVNSTLKILSAGIGTGDMLQSQYDDGTINGGAPNLIIEKAAKVMIAGAPQGCGSAATFNVPATGNAASGQVVLGSDTRLALATSTTPGLVQPDNITIKQIAGLLKTVLAVAGALGVGAPGTVQPDGVTSTVDSNGMLSIPTATNANRGIVQPDNQTVTIAGGVLSSPIVPITNARVRNTGSQNLPPTQTAYILSWPVIDFQNGATFLNPPNYTQFLIPKNGVYHIGTCASFAFGSGSGWIKLVIFLGTNPNANIIAEAFEYGTQSGNQNPSISISTIWPFTSGQVVSVASVSPSPNVPIVTYDQALPCFWIYRIG